MIMGAMEFILQELEQLRKDGLYNNIRTIGSAQGAYIVVDGKKVLNMCSNNYLGLADHPKLKEAAKAAIEQWGVGPAAVRSIAGTLSIHLDLELKLAEFKGAEDVISFQSGFNSNLAVIPALVAPEDGIYSDELNHASIIDGCRLSRAPIIRYEHCNPNDLDAKLAAEGPKHRRKLVISDGVFSMDGDMAPLPEVVEVAKKHGAMIMVDDAHGEGVVGRGGRGIVDHFKLHGKVDVEIGTMSKAFGVVGGYAAGSRQLIEYLRQRARPFLFSSAVTAADAAACMAAVDIMQASDELNKKLWANADYFKAAMKKAGFDTGRSTTPISPVMLGEAHTAQAFSRRLFEEGIFAMAIGYPTVAKSKARIRVMISATHTRDDLDFALSKFTAIGRDLKVTK
ncbi:MAG: glycine C-acetyltransferase [bacterium]